MKVGKTLGVIGLLAASSLAMKGCCWLFPNDPVCISDPCFTPPAGTVEMNFTIDATARPGMYANEDLEWKGAFVFDKTTRMLTYDGSWTGPYAGLWDDGPWTEGRQQPFIQRRPRIENLRRLGRIRAGLEVLVGKVRAL